MSQMEDVDVESLLICGLLHDVCKIDCYKKSGKEWIWNKDCLPMGHGEKSIYIIQKFMKLTDEEALAIRWHMGGWDDAVMGGSKDYNAANRMTKMVAALQGADLQASNIVERVEEYDL